MKTIITYNHPSHRDATIGWIEVDERVVVVERYLQDFFKGKSHVFSGWKFDDYSEFREYITLMRRRDRAVNQAFRVFDNHEMHGVYGEFPIEFFAGLKEWGNDEYVPMADARSKLVKKIAWIEDIYTTNNRRGGV